MNALRKEAQLAICPPTHNLMDVPDEVRSYHNRMCYQLAYILVMNVTGIFYIF